MEEYLSSLDLAVSIEAPTSATLPRIHQLFQRTNQFNTTTRRYSLEDVHAAASDPNRHLWTLRTRDRFGDHGLVAVALIRCKNRTWTLDSFLMSCRVIGYGVETALLAAVVRAARADGISRIVGEFVPTKKNTPAREMYARHGFVEGGVEGSMELWSLDMEKAGIDWPLWIREESNDS